MAWSGFVRTETDDSTVFGVRQQGLTGQHSETPHDIVRLCGSRE